MASKTPRIAHIPHIHLLCMDTRFSDAFTAARQKLSLPPSLPITIHNCALSQVPSTVRFDTIVSPANSYGRLDGAFDDAISRVISPRDDYLALTRVAQRTLYDRWRGFAPPGSCTLVRVPDEFRPRSHNDWGVRRIALCPTMRLPDDVRWHREVVYQCVWGLLCAVDNHNRAVRAGRLEHEGDADEISSILMTPLGTGVGRIAPERWAEQAVLAIKHFDEASDDPDKWSSLDWHSIEDYSLEVERTWRDGN